MRSNNSLRMKEWEWRDVEDYPSPESDNKWYFSLNITTSAEMPAFRINYQSQHIISSAESQQLAKSGREKHVNMHSPSRLLPTTQRQEYPIFIFSPTYTWYSPFPCYSSASSFWLTTSLCKPYWFCYWEESA